MTDGLLSTEYCFPHLAIKVRDQSHNYTNLYRPKSWEGPCGQEHYKRYLSTRSPNTMAILKHNDMRKRNAAASEKIQIGHWEKFLH